MTPDFGVRIGVVIEDEVSVRRVKPDPDWLASITAPETVALVDAADGHPTTGFGFALPGKGSQVAVYPLQIKESQLVFWSERATWL